MAYDDVVAGLRQAGYSADAIAEMIEIVQSDRYHQPEWRWRTETVERFGARPGLSGKRLVRQT